MACLGRNLTCSVRIHGITQTQCSFQYIVRYHGIDLESSAPLTALETQIIRLLPAAIEYAMSRNKPEIGIYADMAISLLQSPQNKSGKRS